MSVLSAPADPETGIGEWVAAFALVLLLHAGIAALFFSRDPGMSPAEAPPAPILIDLPPIQRSTPSVASQAVQSEAATMPVDTLQPEQVETETPPLEKMVETEAVEPQTPPEEVRPLETTEAPTAEPEAVQTMTAEEAETAPPVAASEVPPSETKTVTEAVVADIPPEEVPDTPDPEALVAAEPAPPVTQARPAPQTPRETRRAPVKEAARPVQRPAAKPTPNPTAVQKPAAPPPTQASAAAAASAGGRPDPSVLGRFISQVRAALERQKRYPAAASGARGKVTVRFTINRSGQVLSTSIVRGAGHPALDQMALAMVRQAGFPAAPPGLPQPSFTISAPVDFAPK
jgi:protein TonB